ncbi:uncharacterized protein LOC136031354 isoform X2 [Artemia franciscana]|uniref:Chitin-binding type-4 domain-containing protein n=1 Tax=Artemia franciscana TaxID=6661 RepID=A0AA88HCG3_ARTSF|nr:hypothetical protein QYM36_016783 [Artemia franciscana]
MILQVWMIWIVVVVHVKGHGRLLDPPQRSSMWRAGYKVPINYDDNGLFCGGMNVIVAKVELTQSHMGFFQFKLCKKETKEELTTQHCLDKNILQLENGSGNKYYVQDPRPGMHYPRIQLPKNLVCENCVLQWHYTAGNNWGDCDNGTFTTGCGPQETFVNCADIRILPKISKPDLKYHSFKNQINSKAKDN